MAKEFEEACKAAMNAAFENKRLKEKIQKIETTGKEQNKWKEL